MRAVTIKEAKARLNQLVDAATKGEQVVLMRGSKHVAAIVPISAEDLELSFHLTDLQADRLRRQLAKEEAVGRTVLFQDADAAVRHLAELAGRRRRVKPRTRRSA
jgi:prevent-host-death family protein